MIKGTTPQHIFSLPFSTEMVKTIQITYAQHDVIKLIKGTEDCVFDGNTVSTRLSQEDTFLFEEGVCVEVQVRVLTNGDDALASNVIRVRCAECLSKDVLE